MITYTDSLNRFVFEVRGSDEFRMTHVDMVECLSRKRMEEIRSIFDQALNTSAEELGDA